MEVQDTRTVLWLILGQIMAEFYQVSQDVHASNDFILLHDSYPPDPPSCTYRTRNKPYLNARVRKVLMEDKGYAQNCKMEEDAPKQ
jgi:hypothetical protein